MKVAVLGGTGGTGRAIVAEARRQGHAVQALVRSAEKAADLAGATLVMGDARDEAALTRAIDGCDAVRAAASRSFQRDHSVINFRYPDKRPEMGNDGDCQAATLIRHLLRLSSSSATA